MEFTLNLTESGDLIALYAAVVATVVLVWDVIKWCMDKASIEVSVNSNMKLFDGIIEDKKTYFLINVRNTGKYSTTVTHVCAFHFDNIFWKYVCHDLGIKKFGHSQSFIIKHADTVYPIPYELKSGRIFTSMAIQTPDLETKAKTGCLCIGIIHIHNTKPAIKRVRIKEILHEQETD